MSVDPDRLRHALWLATGRQTSTHEAQRLASMLGVMEEALPFIVLRRDGFKDSEPVLRALSLAKQRAPQSPRTPRGPTAYDAAKREIAAADLRVALKAEIERSLTNDAEMIAIDAARRSAALLYPHAPGDAPLRIRNGERAPERGPASEEPTGD